MLWSTKFLPSPLFYMCMITHSFFRKQSCIAENHGSKVPAQKIAGACRTDPSLQALKATV
jgi:hypothetical protein